MRRLLAFLVLSAASVLLGVWLVRRAPRPVVDGGQPKKTPAVAARPEPTPDVEGGARVRDAGPAPNVREDPLSVALCPEGMLLAAGAYCPVAQSDCGHAQAGAGARAGAGACPTQCKVEPQVLRYCVDRFEYPNLRGVAPAAMVSFEEAEFACRVEGKRLCSDTEWTFACEGPLAGQSELAVADPAHACQLGHALGPFEPRELWQPDRVAEVFARIDHRAPSGARGLCVGPFGARDLVGNVAEWVAATATLRPGRGVMGGDFASHDVGCRSLQMVSLPYFRAFSTGFRCCADPLVELPGPGP